MGAAGPDDGLARDGEDFSMRFGIARLLALIALLVGSAIAHLDRTEGFHASVAYV